MMLPTRVETWLMYDCTVCGQNANCYIDDHNVLKEWFQDQSNTGSRLGFSKMHLKGLAEIDVTFRKLKFRASDYPFIGAASGS